MDVVFLVGRILFGLLFVFSALTVHLGEGGKTGSGIAILAGGLMIVFGVWADLGAILVIGFLVGITPIMHAFWKIDDEQMRAIQSAMFFKNVALLGAAIIVFWLFNQLVDPPLTFTDALFDRID